MNTNTLALINVFIPIVFGMFAYLLKISIFRRFDELTNTIENMAKQQREDNLTNSCAHKELWVELNKTRMDITRLETIYNEKLKGG